MKKLFTLLLAIFICHSFAASDQKVTVSVAYEIALHNAVGSAVEKNLGTWLKSQSSTVSLSSTDEFAIAKLNIIAKARDFVTDYKVIKKGPSSKGYEVLVDVYISSELLSNELRTSVSSLKTKMDNPSIAFVLTSWEKKGVFTTVVAKGDVKTNNSYSGSAKSSDYAYDEASVAGAASVRESGSGSAHTQSSRSSHANASGYAVVDETESGSTKAGGYAAGYQGRSDDRVDAEYSASRSSDVAYGAASKSERRSDRASSVEGNSESESSFSASLTTGKIDETMYAKFAAMGIIDGFQQEFKEKGFDLKAADKAREIAVAPSAAQTGINVGDRTAVRELAEKEGANFVARGEVMLLSQGKSAATGQPEITAKIGTEIIDVNSGEVVASYSNTVTATNTNIDKDKAQVIKKAAIAAAKTLASQSLQTLEKRAEKGRQYTIEIRNIKKARSQKIPIEKALKSIGSISSQTSPSAGVQDYTVLYKGSKSDLGMALIEALGDAKGFSEEEFDGPSDENGKIIFTFTN